MPKKYTKKEFEKLSFKQRRLLVAKDVLKQLEAKKYKPAGAVVGKNFYGSFYVGATPQGTEFDPMLGGTGGVDAQEFFAGRKAPECHVCAIGAACVSAARVFDRLTLNEVEMLKPLDYLFKEGDMDNMRVAMENDYENVPPNTAQRKKALKKIFTNIVKNKGDYVRPRSSGRKSVIE